MRRDHLGPPVIWGAALVPLVLWLVAERPTAMGRLGRESAVFTDIGQITGLVGTAMLALGFVLSARFQRLEDYFGGLDKMYRLHHRLGLTALVLLAVHPIAHAARFVPDHGGRALTFLLPVHESWSVDVGAFAFWGFVLLMGITLATRVRYDRWKLSHKALGLVLVAGVVHFATVSSTPGRGVAVAASPVLRIYMFALAFVAGACFVYKLLVLPLVSRRHRYTVSAVEKAGERVLRVELAPQGRRLRFHPGQFVFVTFEQQDLPREAHPFTICTMPEEETLAVTVKALGDFTHELYRSLGAGAGAIVEGPYGRFDYRAGSRRQVWIAAGVGVAPFLSWARDLARGADHDQARDVDFYYCVRHRSDGAYFSEFEALAAHRSDLRAHLVCTEERSRLRADEITDLADRDIFMCGPKGFTRDLQKQFLRLGVANERIRFEDFEFR